LTTGKVLGKLAPPDGKVEKDVQKYTGGFSPERYRKELIEAIRIFDDDRFIPWKARVKLIDGSMKIVMCGGRGRRLDKLTEMTSNPLIKVTNKNIWHLN
jgi:hypothetical protein